jgi:hypothetical protein
MNAQRTCLCVKGVTHRARLSNAALAGASALPRRGNLLLAIATSAKGHAQRAPCLGAILKVKLHPLRAGSPTGIEIKSQHPARMP